MQEPECSPASPETSSGGTLEERPQQGSQVIIQVDHQGQVVYVDGGQIKNPNQIRAILSEAHSKLLHLMVLESLPDYIKQLSQELSTTPEPTKIIIPD